MFDINITSVVLQLVLLATFAASLFLFLIRPQMKRAQALKRSLEALKPGDVIVTNGGLVGTVTGLLGDKLVTAQFGDTAEFVVDKAFIHRQEPRFGAYLHSAEEPSERPFVLRAREAAPETQLA